MRHHLRLLGFSNTLGSPFIIASHGRSLLLLTTGISAGAITWMRGWYLILMVATTAINQCLLRYLAHAPSWILGLGCVQAASVGQMGPSWWKAHHLWHHRNSDHPGDPHSPVLRWSLFRGFLWAQGGLLLSPMVFPQRFATDVERDRMLRVLDHFHCLSLLELGKGWAQSAPRTA